MFHRPSFKLSAILSLILFAASLLSPLTPYAFDPTDYINTISIKTPWDYGKEFCDKRSGDLMNLETWFSGKCGAGVDSMSGDGVGFADIVALQGLEALIGPQTKSFADVLMDLFEFVKIKGTTDSTSGFPDMANFPNKNDNKGILGTTADLLSRLVLAKPASSVDYIVYVSNNLKSKHIVGETLAAEPGYGFTALSPILPLWRAFRNISYIIFALIFVVYGFMIMFRVNIGSKTATTIQLALPKLIMTLIIITFSYAIVGLLVDISTVVTALLIDLLRVGNILTDTSNTNWIVQSASGQWGAFLSFFVNFVSAIIFAPLMITNLIFGGVLGQLAGLALLVAGGLGGFGWILMLIIIIAVAISYIKLIFKLFEAFFSVIISLIFAPIILVGNALPGSNALSSWIMSIIGNLSVFPVTVFFLTLSYALMAQPLISIFGSSSLLGVVSLSTTGAGFWTPPIIFPSFGGWAAGSMSGPVLLSTIGFGLLLMAAKYVDMVRDALKVPPFKYGSAIGEALKSGWTKSGNLRSIGSNPTYTGASEFFGLTPGKPMGKAPTPSNTPPAPRP